MLEDKVIMVPSTFTEVDIIIFAVSIFYCGLGLGAVGMWILFKIFHKCKDDVIITH